MKEEIKILKNASNLILGSIIKNTKGSYNSKIDNSWIDEVYNGSVSLNCHRIEWFFPFQAELFNVDEKDSVICFISAVTFIGSDNVLHSILGGYIHYDSISETEINLSYSEDFSTLNIEVFSQFDSEKDMFKTYYEYVDRLENQMKFSNQTTYNDDLMERIFSIEDLEELDLVDEEMYINKIKMLQKIATGGRMKDEEIPRVWGEYSIVSQITSQPILMNKAMCISLTKVETQQLLDQLNKKYHERIKRFKTDGKISLIFSPTLRGHQTSARHEIVLPKLGDWRFGYTDLYSAELIFHEFSHALDTARPSSGTRGKHDVHKHDFVRLLDMVLVDFSDYINERYMAKNQRQQILENNTKLIIFYQNKDKIELDLRKQEKIESEKRKSQQEEIYSKIGLGENSYPLLPLIQENKDIKTQYLKWVLSDSLKDMNKNDMILAKGILSKIEAEDFILTKPEISLLNTTISKSSRNKFVYNLPMKEQLTAGSYISKLENDISELSKGRIRDLEIKDDVRIRTYEEANLLKKTIGYED